MTIEHYPFTNIADEERYAVDRDKRMALASTQRDADLVPAKIQTTPPLPKRAEDKFKIPLICSRSGLKLGDFVPASGLAAATPYVQAWKASSFLHPIFSLPLESLMSRAEACWQLEKTGTRQFPMQHKQLLFLAMLHASDCIKQDVAGLPTPKIVEVHFPRLIELLGWKHNTNSERIKFPALHVWRGASKEDEYSLFGNVPTWLDVVEVVKEEYENVAKTRMKEARRKAHDLAMKNIRKAMYSDVSLRRLWGWFSAQVPQIILENNADLEQLFFTEEMRIHVWSEEDILAIEDLFLKYCELGNSVSHEFQKQINVLRTWLTVYKDTFEISDATSEQFTEHKGIPEPKPEDFSNRAKFLVASAKWQLANRGSKGVDEL